MTKSKMFSSIIRPPQTMPTSLLRSESSAMQLLMKRRPRCVSCCTTTATQRARTSTNNAPMFSVGRSRPPNHFNNAIISAPLLRQQQRQLQKRARFSTKSQHQPNSSSQQQTRRTNATLLHNYQATTHHATPTSHPLLRLFLQSLQHTLLKPRSLPLPRYISPQHFTFTLSECFGHSSFILVAASYYSQDFLELRIMAVLGSTSMLFFTYFHPHGRVLWLPLKWNVLFIAINSYRIGKVYFERYKAQELSDELKVFREEHLPIVDMVDYYKMIKIGKEEVFEEGDLVVQQGQSNPYIRIVLEGELEVLRDGTLTYLLEKGNFVSEAGLHSGLMLKGSIESCGTIVVGPPFDPTGKNNVDSSKKNKVRCIKWNRTELMELLKDDKGLRNALKAAMSWDIVRKLKTQRHMLTEGRVKNATAWTKRREDQGISRYAALLQNMLQHPEDFHNMYEVLTRYRRIHRIDDVDHERALAKCGWTEEEFRLGKRNQPIEEDDEDDIDDEEFESGRWRRVKRYSSKLVRSLLQ